MSEPLTLAALAPLPYWVAWQQETRQAGKPPTKVPYAPRGGRAHADKPHTWGDRPAAESRAAMLQKPFGIGGVGIEFAPLGDGRNLGGIDLDACRNADSGTLEAWAEDVLAGFDSYAEVSPSGSGAKLFFTYPTDALAALQRHMGDSKFGKQYKREGGDHPPAIELHLGNRYFAVTDAVLTGSRIDLRHVEHDQLLRLIQTDGPAFVGAAKTKPARGKRKSIVGLDRSRSAMAFGVGKRAVMDGATFDEMCAVLRDNSETSDWMREKGEANGQREARRIFEKLKAAGPLIRVIAGELHDTATKAEAAIISGGLTIYQRGNGLVRPVLQDVPAAKGRLTFTAALHDITPHGLIDALCSCATFERFDARAEDWIRINPPKQVAEIILSRAGLWTLPKVVGVVTCPTLRPDGSILSAPGYDGATRLYHAADPAVRLTPAVHNPTRAAAEAALRDLSGLLTEFPFTSDVSRAVALSALITPVVRGALTVAPLHAIRANTAGSGKSYVVDTASAIATGRACPVAAAGPDEIETEKRLAGLLLGGFPLASLDNVNGELGGDLLCQAIERPLIRIRRLGASDIIEIESRATIFATGNALRVRGDMTRRTVVCDLDAKMERPELRKFTGDPVAIVMANRGRYVSACLVIVRAYLLTGSPGTLPPIASFSDWSNLVRSALVWLGCADPADSMEAAREDDPELAELREIVGLWREALPIGSGMTSKQLVDWADGKKPNEQGRATADYAWPDLRELFIRVAGDRNGINTNRLGARLRKHEGRVVEGHCVKRDETATGPVIRWKLDKVKAA